MRRRLWGRRRACGGFTLLEVLIAGVVLTVGVVGMSGAMLTALALQRSEADGALARQAARRTLEQLQAVDFDEVYACYNADTADDAGLITAARGANFTVAGLNLAAGDGDGQCGEVIFPTVTLLGTQELREDVVDPGLGMPQDLNSDGAVDAVDHSADYALLPVRVRVQWRGVGGTERYDLETILCRRR